MNLTFSEFERLMQTVSVGWNEGNAPKSADCFSEDTIYVEPPEVQLYHGRDDLYPFFGRDSGTDIPMKMTRHHLAFKEREQIGFGEYTFAMHGRYHGIVVVQIESGLIKQWREYQYPTRLDWEEFTSHNPF